VKALLNQGSVLRFYLKNTHCVAFLYSLWEVIFWYTILVEAENKGNYGRGWHGG
jgi:hypothetical protein